MDYRTAKFLRSVTWFVLISAVVLISSVLMGQAQTDLSNRLEKNNQAEHQRQIECIQAGGHTEYPSGRSGGSFCTK